MEITGHIIEICEKREGESKNGHWIMQDFAIRQKSIHDSKEYITDIAFTVFNEKCMIPNIGTAVKVHFGTSSRKYEGKWYTQNTAYKTEILPTAGNHAESVPLDMSKPVQYSDMSASQTDNSNLPF